MLPGAAADQEYGDNGARCLEHRINVRAPLLT
jgi:hypothetical protein